MFLMMVSTIYDKMKSMTSKGTISEININETMLTKKYE